MISQKVPRPVIARNGATKQSDKMEYKFDRLEMVRLLRSARNDSFFGFLRDHQKYFWNFLEIPEKGLDNFV